LDYLEGQLAENLEKIKHQLALKYGGEVAILREKVETSSEEAQNRVDSLERAMSIRTWFCLFIGLGSIAISAVVALRYLGVDVSWLRF